MEKFTLPCLQDRCTELQNKHPLGSRERRIRFFEQEHIYFVDGIQLPRSVTSLINDCRGSPRFDPIAALLMMRSSRRWTEKRLEFLRSGGSEMCDSEIVSMWERRSRVSSSRGILLHYHAECWCNGRCVGEPWSP